MAAEKEMENVEGRLRWTEKPKASVRWVDKEVKAKTREMCKSVKTERKD